MNHNGRLLDNGDDREFTFAHEEQLLDALMYGRSAEVVVPVELRRSEGAGASERRGRAVGWEAIAEVLGIDASILRNRYKTEPALQAYIKKHGKAYELNVSKLEVFDWMRLYGTIQNARRTATAVKGAAVPAKSKATGTH